MMIPFIGIPAILLIAVLAGGLQAAVGATVRARRRTTGIVGLNLLLDGGFPEGSLVMVYGTPVAGVDLAAAQFMQGDDDGPGTYLMTDEIISLDTREEEGIKPELFLSRMEGNRIVMDSVSSIIDRYGIDETLRLLRLVKTGVGSRGANVMFIVFADIHTPMEMTKLMRAADVVIEFKTNIQQSEIERTLAVQKIRNSMAPRRLLPFIITEKGIEASTTSRVV